MPAGHGSAPGRAARAARPTRAAAACRCRPGWDSRRSRSTPACRRGDRAGIPAGVLSRHLIWVRTLQDILLGIVAPALLVLGAPWLVLCRGLGPGAGQAALARAAAAGSVPPRWRSWPVAVTAVFTLVWCGWYVPPLYDAGLQHPLVSPCRWSAILAVGVLFWLQLIGSRPFSPRFGPLHRVMLIASCVVTGTILGMVLGFGAQRALPGLPGGGAPSACSRCPTTSRPEGPSCGCSCCCRT